MTPSAHDAIDRAYAAIGTALAALDEARGMLAAGNLKPAPFPLVEPVVRSLIDPAAPAAPRMVDVPIAAVALVDRPRRSQDPRLARANDDAVPEVSGGATRTFRFKPAQPSAVPPSSSEPASGRAPATAKKPRRGKAAAQASEPASVNATRDDVQPEHPAPAFRTAAQKLALPASTSDFRASVRAPAEAPKIPIPPLPAFARRQRLQAAIMHLKRQCILVSPVDRSALVMRYRVSGKHDPMYADDVIAFAETRGFDVEGAAK